MKKEITAILAALAITGAIGFSILLLGLNVLLSQKLNGSADQTPGANQIQGVAVSSNPAAAQDMQTTINQYQAQLDQTQQELEAATNQIQQYRQLVRVLAQQGLIQIAADGTIYIQQSK